uniref:Uncharacterized protein n=1 Tax=viral metagenome TaxID=1070528 RepID=A0A6C0IHZ3_9ZZZZ
MSTLNSANDDYDRDSFKSANDDSDRDSFHSINTNLPDFVNDNSDLNEYIGKSTIGSDNENSSDEEKEEGNSASGFTKPSSWSSRFTRRIRNLATIRDTRLAGSNVFVLKNGINIPKKPENYFRANVIDMNTDTREYNVRDTDGNVYEKISETQIIFDVLEFIELLKTYPKSNIRNLFGIDYPDVNMMDRDNYDIIHNYIYKPRTPWAARNKTRKVLSAVLPIESYGRPKRELIIYVMHEINSPEKNQTKAGEKDSRHNIWLRAQLLSIDKVAMYGQLRLKYRIQYHNSPKIKELYNRTFQLENDEKTYGSQIITEKQYYEFIQYTALRETEKNDHKTSDNLASLGGKRKRTRKQKNKIRKNTKKGRVLFKISKKSRKL